MWSRLDLKSRGKIAFLRNYWAAVVVALVLAIVSGGFTGNSRGSDYVRDRVDYSQFNSNVITETAYDITHILDNGFFGIPIFSAVLGMFAFALTIVLTLLKIFVGNMLIIGGKRFFMENREQNTRIPVLLSGFKNGSYGNIVLTMFLRDLFTLLWTFLFIIPGIIKYYEYRMIPYLLCENPGMDRKQAFDISKQMMYGQKMNTFLLDLSFIGWLILSVFTCNILSIFFVNPYMESTVAELYAVLRAHALHTGHLTSNELPGFNKLYY